MKTSILSRKKLNRALLEKGLSLASLAKNAGISRQSLYQMFWGKSVFSTPFQKVLEYLGVEPAGLLEEQEVETNMLSKAPSAIRKAALQLTQFAKKTKASLVLFGSQVRGGTFQSDWDFGLFFEKDSDNKDRALRLLKQKCIDAAFPYRIDVVNLSRAPAWFRSATAESYAVLHGTFDTEKFLHKAAA